MVKLIPKDKKGNWIQGAVNPKHKGFCTPMTKSTCTPRRKAFAMTMKKHHGFHKKEEGGEIESPEALKEEELLASSRPRLRRKVKVNKTFRGSGKSKCRNRRLADGTIKEECDEVAMAKEGMITTGGKGPRKVIVEKNGGTLFSPMLEAMLKH